MTQKTKKGWSHRIKDLEKPLGIVMYCAKAFPILGSKSAVKKAIVDGRLMCNGRLAGFSNRVKNGDFLELKGSGIQKARKFDIDIEVVYQDDHLIIVNKPAGIAVNGNRIKTLENALGRYNQNNREPDALARPIAVHRIDVPTTGLVLVAKTKSALIQLSKAFQQNQIKKKYVALVHGKPPEKGRIDEAIEGKEAITDFERIQMGPSRVFKHLSLMALYPQTGRTHQLRIHLKNRGHFIVGDKLYSERQKTILGKGLFLCACELTFVHPKTSKSMIIKIDPPKKFKKVLKRETDRFKK